MQFWSFVKSSYLCKYILFGSGACRKRLRVIRSRVDTHKDRRIFFGRMMEDIKITKLQEESQWASWKFQVKVTLIAAEVYDVVSGIEIKPEEGEANYDAAIKVWRKSDAKAQRIIGSTVGNSQLTHIMNCDSAKDMWDRLHAVFEKKSETSLLLLYQKLKIMKK